MLKPCGSEHLRSRGLACSLGVLPTCRQVSLDWSPIPRGDTTEGTQEMLGILITPHPFVCLFILPPAWPPSQGQSILVGSCAGFSFVERIKGPCRSLSFHVQRATHSR